ncbi:VOC family protein [Tessaracoccus sp. MC1679]|uniref:VOC family protein n=1 Tax=Tessaracoccus sp. MC1679 TaxID=2760313 RepID=UPI0015FF6B5E|nr:VOC family protein [Tessaracoccus sp. MC1679]MBB1516769.1 VOC family protein [Tessaracoccus sp. MC1679]
MQKIVPNLWFDHSAASAAAFYCSVLPDARVTVTQHYPTEGLADFQQDFAGDVLYVEFEVGGYAFGAINAGPEFRANPSVSFFLYFDPTRDDAAREKLDRVWDAFADGGEVLMPLGEYAYSRRFGWVQDKFGVSWQLVLSDPDAEPRPFIVPCLLFAGAAKGRGGEALERYTSVFPDSQVTVRVPQEVPDAASPGQVEFAVVRLLGQSFSLMDSEVDHAFTFTPGVSLEIRCDDQAEIDRYWAALSEVPEAEACGWCADRFGVSWQVTPSNMAELMERAGAFQTMMGMKKLEIAAF